MSATAHPRTQIRPSSRISGTEEHYFAPKLEKLRQMKEAGKKIIDLGVGAPTGMPPGSIIEAARASLSKTESHRYSIHRGKIELRRAFARWFRDSFRVDLEPESQVLPLLGSKEGIFCLSQALLNPGDEVLVPDPGYLSYRSAALMAGARVRAYDLSPDFGWKPDLDLLDSTDLSKVKLMWVNYPHMPTGTSADPQLFRDLVEFGKRHDILICHDNPYSLTLCRDRPLSILEFDPKLETTVELNSLSKSHRMSGWRVGVLAANSEVIDWTLRVRTSIDSGMFPVVQDAAIAALSIVDPAEFTEQNKRDERAQALVVELLQTLGFSVELPQQGLFVWAKSANTDSIEEMLDQLLEEAGVFLVPGRVFGAGGSDYIRASICPPIEQIEDALNRVKCWVGSAERKGS